MEKPLIMVSSVTYAMKGKQLLKGIKGGASKTPSADAMTYGILFTFRQPPKNS